MGHHRPTRFARFIKVSLAESAHCPTSHDAGNWTLPYHTWRGIRVRSAEQVSLGYHTQLQRDSFIGHPWGGGLLARSLAEQP